MNGTGLKKGDSLRSWPRRNQMETAGKKEEAGVPVCRWGVGVERFPKSILQRGDARRGPVLGGRKVLSAIVAPCRIDTAIIFRPRFES
jgi:hypothetical protein